MYALHIIQALNAKEEAPAKLDSYSSYSQAVSAARTAYWAVPIPAYIRILRIFSVEWAGYFNDLRPAYKAYRKAVDAAYLNNR